MTHELSDDEVRELGARFERMREQREYETRLLRTAIRTRGALDQERHDFDRRYVLSDWKNGRRYPRASVEKLLSDAEKSRDDWLLDLVGKLLDCLREKSR